MSTILARGAEGLDRRGFSYADVEAMQAAGILDPDEKFELIDGEIVPMNAQNMPYCSGRRGSRVGSLRAWPPRWN